MKGGLWKYAQCNEALINIQGFSPTFILSDKLRRSYKNTGGITSYPVKTVGMKLKVSLIIFIFHSALCSGQYLWTALPTAPVSLRFDDFYFTNPDTGWAINPNYSFYTAAPQYGRIFRTYDGGNTWTKLKDGSNTFYRSVGFADALTGWIGNIADTALHTTYRYTTDTIPLYRTDDGGVTWNPANLPQPHPLGICGISVLSDSVVYAYGRYFGPAAYLKTIDKGASWISVNLDTLAVGLIDGHFFNKDTGFITAMGADHKAAILYTDNGGASWRYSYHSIRTDSDRVWKIYFPSRNVGYASIEYGGTNSGVFNTYFVKTTNGGNTWTEHPFIASYNEEGIGFANDSVGWIGGDGTRGTYITTDGGNTWNTDESFGLVTPPYTSAGTAGFHMNRFRSFGDTLMYASGNTIYKLKTATTGIKNVDPGVHSIKSVPNPFSNETLISYSLPGDAEDLIMEVFTATGSNILTNHLGRQSKGDHEVVFKEILPMGIYYCVVRSDQFRLVGKMVVIR